MSDPPTTVTRLLGEVRAGSPAAFDELLPILYGELKERAQGQRRRWQGDDTLNTTALIHEAYLKLAAADDPDWESRAHFLAVGEDPRTSHELPGTDIILEPPRRLVMLDHTKLLVAWPDRLADPDAVAVGQALEPEAVDVPLHVFHGVMQVDLVQRWFGSCRSKFWYSGRSL